MGGPDDPDHVGLEPSSAGRHVASAAKAAAAPAHLAAGTGRAVAAGMRVAGTGAEWAGKATRAAGKGADAAGAALTASGVGAPIGGALKGLGGAAHSAGSTTEVAGQATSAAGEVAGSAADAADQAGSAIAQTGASIGATGPDGAAARSAQVAGATLEGAGKGVRAGGQTAKSLAAMTAGTPIGIPLAGLGAAADVTGGAAEIGGAALGGMARLGRRGTAGAGGDLADKVRAETSGKSALGKVDGALAAGDGVRGGMSALLNSLDDSGRLSGMAKQGYDTAAKALKAATPGVYYGWRVGMVGVTVLALLLTSFLLVGGQDTTATYSGLGGDAEPAPEVEGVTAVAADTVIAGVSELAIPATWLRAYRDTGYDWNVPWSLLAGIGRVASEHGATNPYTGTAIDPPSLFPRPAEPIGVAGAGGTGPLLISDHALQQARERVDTQDARAAMEFAARALERWADDALSTGTIHVGTPPADGAAGQGADVRETLRVTDDVRYANFDRRYATGITDEHVAAQVDFWMQGLIELGLFEPTGNELCWLSPAGLSVPQLIDIQVRCALNTLDGDLYVINPATQTAYDADAAVRQVIFEMVNVAWAYNRWGASQTCTSGTAAAPNGSGGVFPLPSDIVVEDYDSNGDGRADSTRERVVWDRCNDQANIARMTELLLTALTVPPRDRPGNVWEQAAYGWSTALPDALGSANTFTVDGPHDPDANPDAIWENTENVNACRAGLDTFALDMFGLDDVFPESWQTFSDPSQELPAKQLHAMLIDLQQIDLWAQATSVCEPGIFFASDGYTSTAGGPLIPMREAIGLTWDELAGVTDPADPDAAPTQVGYHVDPTWAHTFNDAFFLRDPDGTRVAGSDPGLRALVAWHQQITGQYTVGTEWGVTSSVERLARPAVSVGAPAWTSVAGLPALDEVMRYTLAYVGEDPAAFGFGAATYSGSVGLAAAGISVEAATAYQTAHQWASVTYPDCGIRLELIAAVGWKESSHGTSGGAAINPGTYDVTYPSGQGIVSPVLDGTGNGGNTTPYYDIDNGVYDYDTQWQHAVGPMQFMVGTWFGVPESPNRPAATKPTIDPSAVDANGMGPGSGVDGNADGIRNPHNYIDATASAAKKLCSDAPNGQLKSVDAELAALMAYNADPQYGQSVVAEADRIKAAMVGGGGLGGVGVPGDLLATLADARAGYVGTRYSQCIGARYDVPGQRCGPGGRFGYVVSPLEPAYSISNSPVGYDPHFDCSGLVTRVFANYGVKIPVDALTTYGMVYGTWSGRRADVLVAERARNGAPFQETLLQPGDILVYNSGSAGHTGIYIGGDAVLEAAGSDKDTLVQSFSGTSWGTRATHVFRPANLGLSTEPIPERYPVG